MRNPELLKQFRSFYFRNYPQDMEVQIEYFSIFGGLGIDIDTTKPLLMLIQEHILENFEQLNSKFKELSLYEKPNKRLLRAFAVGDRRIFSAFNKAGLNNGNGGAALNLLEEMGIISLEYSREKAPPKDKKLKREVARHRISHKVLFTKPFIRFWFYFVIPYKKEIQEQNYEDFFENFQKKQHSYTSLIFEELSEILLNYHLQEVQIVSSGSYWDAKLEIDLLTVTDRGEIYIAECKWTNHKVNKKEFHKLKEKCEMLRIIPRQIAFFSKRGFSKELLSMQSKELALYSCEDFEVLVKDSSKEEPLKSFLD